MHKQAAATYQRTLQATVNPIEREAFLLVKAASQIQAAKDCWLDRDILDTALVYNRRLWTVFISSLLEADHPLPLPIRQNVVNLGYFVLNHTLSIEAKPEVERLSVLISINKNIAEGLRATPSSNK